ncbi:MAG TPA: aminotransferase class V-fold PLP-dependent enzyme [Pirellulaceae bacterium]|nr:aminotransferase class V-fold PLP-dependent enzyme [Pirellulaceae bacterium]
MGVYESLGLTPVINASGAVTRLGGAPMPKTVLDAFQEAAGDWVPLDRLQAAACKMISQVTGTESGIVTAGSAAALTLGTAAIMARMDPGKMERLPQTDGFANEFVVAREHRNGYDHAVRAAGARFVEVGYNEITAGAGVRRVEAWEYEAAFTERTAGVFYVYLDNSAPPLEEVVKAAHRHELPVLVDAAGELPPRSNLMLASATGADLIAFSGGKAIRGPQSSGILCGRRDLIGSAALQMLDMDDHFELWEPPSTLFDADQLVGAPRHGIGRAMKVSKEEIVALTAALALFANGGYDDEIPAQLARLQSIADKLGQGDIEFQLHESPNGESSPILEVYVSDARNVTAVEVCRNLRKGTPPIYVSHGKLSQGILVVHPLCMTDAGADSLADRLLEELG